MPSNLDMGCHGIARNGTVWYDVNDCKHQPEFVKTELTVGSTKETRVIDPKTGGEKGQKECQMGAVDPKALEQVGLVAGFGNKKYARYNFAKGYKWSLSYDALQRHLMAFWGGENTDPESGLPHLGHAAWHCLALLTFSLRSRGTDDRFPTEGV